MQLLGVFDTGEKQEKFGVLQNLSGILCLAKENFGNRTFSKNFKKKKSVASYKTLLRFFSLFL